MDKSDEMLLRLIRLMGADKVSDNAMMVVACLMVALGFIIALAQ